MKRLLIVYASQTGRTERMAGAVYRGALGAGEDAVSVRMLRARDAGVTDLVACDALALGTPENFGYMSGAMKDFLDRTYYPCQGRVESLPYAVFISAGNDGTGALRAIERIAKGYPFKTIQPAIISAGALHDETLARCEELGAAIAAGLALGVF